MEWDLDEWECEKENNGLNNIEARIDNNIIMSIYVRSV